MKAALVTRYGPPDVVTVGDAPKPVPADTEVLIRVHATTVNRTDCGERGAHPFFARAFYGWRRPNRTILGMDVAGVVEAVGAKVTALKPGDRVFGMAPSRRNGAQAEYLCVDEDAPLALLPEGLGFEEGVVCEGAFYANAGLTAIGLAPGHRILVYGASGAIGTAAVQLAKYYGAEVTAVVAARHVATARKLGADQVIDYATSAYRQLGPDYDFVHDAVGKMSPRDWRRLLKPGGVFATTDIGPKGQSLMLWAWSLVTRSGRVRIPVRSRASAPGFVRFMRDRLAAGEFHAVIDRSYPLDAVADAYRYVETGQKQGIVVVDVAGIDRA